MRLEIYRKGITDPLVVDVDEPPRINNRGAAYLSDICGVVPGSGESRLWAIDDSEVSAVILRASGGREMNTDDPGVMGW